MTSRDSLGEAILDAMLISRSEFRDLVLNVHRLVLHYVCVVSDA